MEGTVKTLAITVVGVIIGIYVKDKFLTKK